ncbi:MAG: DUF6377 domain-containing protein [Alistipes sp.]|nr:DUF6377 domain-containing protein [Alistipes sp.]
MKKIPIAILALLLPLPGWGNGKLDSLLNEVDKSIRSKSVYSLHKEARLDSLRTLYGETDEMLRKIGLANALTLEYIVYRTDSALHYVNIMADHASELGNELRIAEAAINKARTLRVMGSYKEASDLLDSIRSGLPERKIPDYLDAKLSILNAMREFAIEASLKEHYSSLAAAYRDSLLVYYTPNPMTRMFVQAEQYLSEKRYDEALADLRQAYGELDPTVRNAGIIAYSMAVAYNAMGDREKETEYYARSAIADLRAGVKDYTSLRRLAELMYEKGDIDRAYNYMKCSFEDALFCNARLMALETSDMFLVIDRSYLLKEKKRKEQLIILLTVTGILALMLLATLLTIRKQNRKLVRARDKLSLSNMALNETNAKLLDSNRIKEEYIGLYMEQLSNYLTKVTSLRNKAHKNAKGGTDVRGLLTTIDDAINIEDELKEFYRNFDATILHLFPRFPEQFDELLVPEARGVYTKTKDGLSPALRIFALIRIGITDSMKIASFLRYSSSTIYNYRTKLRNCSLGPRDDFEAQVMKIDAGQAAG